MEWVALLAIAVQLYTPPASFRRRGAAVKSTATATVHGVKRGQHRGSNMSPSSAERSNAARRADRPVFVCV